MYGFFLFAIISVFSFLTAKFPKPKDGKVAKKFEIFRTRNFFSSGVAKKILLVRAFLPHMVIATGGGGDDDGIAANEKLAIMKFFLDEQLSAMAMTAATAEAVMEATEFIISFQKHCCYAPLPKTGIHVKLGKRQLLIDLQ